MRRHNSKTLKGLIRRWENAAEYQRQEALQQETVAGALQLRVSAETLTECAEDLRYFDDRQEGAAKK